MITLTPHELVLVKLAIEPNHWSNLTDWIDRWVRNRDTARFVNFTFRGLTVEKFDRDAPLSDTSAYGVDSPVGPVIGVYLYENTNNKPQAFKYKLAFNNGRASVRVMGFHTYEQREEFLARDYPFQVSEMFF